MKDPVLKDLIEAEILRISDLVVEIDVLLMANPTPKGTIYSIAQEITGHAAYLMKLCKAQAIAEAEAQIKAQDIPESEAQKEIF